MAAGGATVLNCPRVFARSGVTAAFGRFAGHGVRTVVGTDGYNMDLLGELNAASMISKIASGRADVANAPELIESVTATAAALVKRPDLGIIYTTSKSKIAEHGGLSDDDRKVTCFCQQPKTQEEARDSIEKGVKGALETAALEGIRSIALPLFGTGGLATYPVSAAESLKRTIVAAEDFVQAHPDTPTKDIRVVAYYEPRENVLNGIQKTLAELNQQ